MSRVVEQFMADAGFTYRHADGFDSVSPPPSEATLREAMESGNREAFLAALRQREEAFRRWEFEPIDPDWLRGTRTANGRMVAEQPRAWGFEPPTWREADEQLTAAKVIVAAFGTNRGGKTWWALKRACEAARAYPKSVILIMSETDKSSVGTAQKIVWGYLQPWLQQYNEDHKRHSVVKVNYSQANGFTDGKIVLPGGSEIIFDTYKAEPTKYEGFEFGARVTKPAHRADGSVIENIGFVADESCPLAWLETLNRRARFRRCKGIWAFTPINGLTPAMKDFLGTPQILTDRPAEHLPQARVPGCRPGHMPRTGIPAFPGGRVIWFHLGDNPLGSYTQTVLEATQNRSTEVRERLLYGYARDSVARAFPKYNEVHVVGDEALPKTGTLYQFVDPAGSRNFATLWVVAHGDGSDGLTILDEWPDKPSHGEWAVVTERETTADSMKGWDGDPGPAQNSLGYGEAQYKKLFLEVEKRHPYPLAYRYVDRRFGNTETQQRDGVKSWVDVMEDEHTDPVTGETLGPMIFDLAPSKDIDHGLAQVNGLLAYDDQRPVIPGVNAPRLHVHRRCEQTRWCLENYTGKSGMKGASKDFADLLRYLAEVDPQHIPQNGLRCWGPEQGDEED